MNLFASEITILKHEIPPLEAHTATEKLGKYIDSKCV